MGFVTRDAADDGAIGDITYHQQDVACRRHRNVRAPADLTAAGQS